MYVHQQQHPHDWSLPWHTLPVRNTVCKTYNGRTQEKVCLTWYSLPSGLKVVVWESYLRAIFDIFLRNSSVITDGFVSCAAPWKVTSVSSACNFRQFLFRWCSNVVLVQRRMCTAVHVALRYNLLWKYFRTVLTILECRGTTTAWSKAWWPTELIRALRVWFVENSQFSKNHRAPTRTACIRRSQQIPTKEENGDCINMKECVLNLHKLLSTNFLKSTYVVPNVLLRTSGST